MASNHSNSPELDGSHQPAGHWTTVAATRAQGALDCWVTYLVARQAEGGVALDVFGETVIGEIPQDWYDEDGQLLPRYRTDEGDIRLPEVFNGKLVTGHDGEYILGEMRPCNDRSQVILPSLDLSDIHDALEQLNWDVDDFEDVRDELKERFGSADVEISHQGSLVLFCPRTPDARAWLTENVEGSALWSGFQLVVEHRFARALIEGLQAEGFRTSG